uniref:C2H2-type domain-containing protein n=1 Tax=Parascaris univalens TaxID=6257 RepID=A0A914ZEE2_PARUN
MSRRFTCTVESDDALETIPSTASITPESSSAEKVEPRFMDIQVSIEKLASASGSSTRCEHCTRTFDNLNALHMHLVKTHNLMYSDADCRLFHRTPNSQRGVKHRYYCPIKQCRYNSGAQYFSAYKLLSQHYKKVHTKKTLRCSKCNMAFSLQRDLTYHVRRRCALRERSSTESTVESGRTKDAIPTQSRGVSRVDESHTVTPKVSTTVFVSPFVVFNIYRDALQHGSSTTSHILKKFVFVFLLNSSNIENQIIAQNVL